MLTWSRWCLLILIASIAAAPSVANAHRPVAPGSYAVSIQGRLPSNAHFARLSMYSFQAHPDNSVTTTGGMRQDFFYWDSSEDNTSDQVSCDDNPRLVFGWNTSKAQPFKIGSTHGRAKLDHDKPLCTACAFHRGQLKQLFGTWTLLDDRTIQIAWNGGDTELWKLTWYDEQPELGYGYLYKIELVNTNYTVGNWFFDGIRRHVNDGVVVDNAGFGLGAGGTGFETAVNDLIAHHDIYRGNVVTFNAWYSPPQMSIGPGAIMDLRHNVGGFELTKDAGQQRTLRNEWGDCKASRDADDVCTVEPDLVLSYFARPLSNPGLLARRVMYHQSHDFNKNGFIADDFGHIWPGLQIIDTNNQLRGFVFVQVAPASAPPTSMTLSVAYYMRPSFSCDALLGVDPDRVESGLPGCE